MTPNWMGVLVLTLCVALPVAAQDSRPDFAAEYQSLESAFRKESRDFQASIQKLFKEAQAKGAQVDYESLPKPPDADFVPRFEALAERSKGTDTELSCLLWVFQFGGEGVFAILPPSGEVKQPQKQTADMKAAAAIMERHASSPKLGDFAPGLMYRGGLPGNGDIAREYLAKLAKDSPHKEVRASAITAQLLPAHEGGDKAKAEPLIALLKKDYSETKIYKEQVEGILFEREFLSIGKVAPDFELSDIDGKSFKLSDYRGKVVYLDYWGFW